MPLVQGGRARALGVSSLKPHPSFPDVPAIAEQVPGYYGDAWHGLFAPAGTPAPVIAKLNAEITRVLNAPDVARKLAGDGAEIAAGPAQEFSRFVDKERQKLSRVIAAANIRID